MKRKKKLKTPFEIAKEVANQELNTKRYHVKVKDNLKYNRTKSKEIPNYEI